MRVSKSPSVRRSGGLIPFPVARGGGRRASVAPAISLFVVLFDGIAADGLTRRTVAYGRDLGRFLVAAIEARAAQLTLARAEMDQPGATQGP
jgi:hypothetical protein